MKSTIFVALGVLFVLASCKKEKTSWTSDWVVPLVSDTLSLKTLENDSTLVVNSFSNYEVDLTRTLANIRLIDSISIPDTTISQGYQLSVSSINIPPGYTIVNEIEEHNFAMPNGIQLKKVRVEQGIIRVKVYNPMETTAYFTIELPGVTKDGVMFSQDYIAPPELGNQPGLVNADLDISGYWLDLTGEFGDSYNVLQSRLIVSSSSTGPTVTLTSSDVIQVDAKFEDVKLDYARGYFGNPIYTDTVSTTIDLLDVVESGTLDLPGTTLQFEIENGLKLNSRATLTLLENTNYLGNTVALSSSQIGNPIYINQATGSWSTLAPSVQTIEFNPSNSNLEAYLENLGKTHNIGYKLELNPWGNVSGGYDEIFPTSRLKVKVHAELPLTIGMDALTLRDTFDLDIKQNEDKTHIESGDLVLNATNAFPFKGQVMLYLLDANGQTLHTIVGSEPLESSVYGQIDATDGLKKMKSELHFPLTTAMVSDLDIIKKVCVRAILDTPEAVSGNSVATPIPAGAFISVKLKAMFRLKNIL